MSVISITNQKGGVGKTTVTINLSSALAELGQRVLLIDLDPQGNATTSLGFTRSDLYISTYEVLIEGMSAKAAIFRTVQANLEILPANENLPGAEIELTNRPDRAAILKNALAEIRGDYDYILIDCPPSLGLLTVNALTASDTVLIPMQAEFLALEGLTQLLKTIEIVKEGLNPDLDLSGVLFTMYDGRTRLTREVENEVRNFFEGRSRVFETVIPRTVRLAEAPSHGIPITMYASSSNGAQAFRSLASEVNNVTQTRAGKGIESPDTRIIEPAGHSPGSHDIHSGPVSLGERDQDRGDQAESPPAPA